MNLIPVILVNIIFKSSVSNLLSLVFLQVTMLQMKKFFALYREVNKFALAAHFLWGLWGLIQAQLSDIDFDYLSYAKLRFNEYYNRKDEFLSL